MTTSRPHADLRPGSGRRRRNPGQIVLGAAYLCFLAVLGAEGHLEPALLRGPSPDTVLMDNNVVTVPFGRSVHVDPVSDLAIQVRPGDRCVVTVLENDPLSQRPGMLSPEQFPCDFGPEDVKYTHFGSRSPSRDRVRLQLRYDTPSDTILLPFLLQVQVSFQQLRVLTRNVPLVVKELNGASNPIDAKVLGFNYDRDSESCRLTALLGTGGLPRYGSLSNFTGGGRTADCAAFVKAGVRYQHTASTGSPNRDYLPMRVELLDGHGAPVSQEHFQVTVRILQGTENTAPRPSFVAMLMMEVDQFVMTAITGDMLAAEDLETDAEQLIFNVTSPLGQRQGHLISTDDQNLPVTSFYQRDIRELKIAYRPPAADSDTERIFQLELQAVDAEGAISEPFAFVIVVKPMNTLAPVATRNGGQRLFEGQSRPLDLRLSDEDDLPRVRVAVLHGLRHGRLSVLGTPRTWFTPAELHAGLVVYQHDGSDTHSDNVVFRMSDGRHRVEFLFPISIAPTDDQPPVVNANTGLALPERRTQQISPFALSASDVDSPDSAISFVLQPPYSPLGVLLLRQSEPSGLRPHLHTDEQVVTQWTQQDLLDGKLYYRHVGPHRTHTVMDTLVFRVHDDHDPPNQSGEHTLVVKVQPVDDLPPEVFPGTTLQMVVEEYQLSHLRKKLLRYTDLDSDDRLLRYTVLSPPTDVDENNQVKAGDLVLTEKPEVAISEFTQAQVNHHKVSYRPPDQELGVTPRVVQFTYVVQDPAGNSARGTFTIFLQPVDNNPPQITNTGFTVSEGGDYVLTNAELDASDPDTDQNRITFTLTRAPEHGRLQYMGITITEGESFVLDDIANGRVVYWHSGDEATTDSFKLNVADLVHEVPVTIRVTVRPVDDQTPTIILPDGQLGSHIDVLENRATKITTNVIRGTDEDTDDLLLTFIVENPPKLGEILVHGLPVERFTQQDVISGAVVYSHTSGEIGTQRKQDSFNLTLSDMSNEWVVGGNKVQGVRVQVTVLPLDNVAPEVNVGEQYTVREGEKNVITMANLNAEDLDTPIDDILCTIIVQSTSGYVENISPAPGSEKSRSGVAISAFTIKDIHDGHIYYMQSIHKGIEKVEDRFTFHCSDGINFSQRHFFPIVIIPTNDEKPELFVREFVVMEGMSLVVDTPILNAADADIPPNKLHFILTKPPQHGQFVQQSALGPVPIKSFTLEDISIGSTVVYEHDDSETKEDNFDIRLTDGKHIVEKTVLIVIIPVDDETPRMTINDGLEVERGELKIITNKVLKATDLDSDDKTLTYIIRYSQRKGLLQHLMKDGDVVQNLTVGMNFTQDEIDKGLIQYVHTGQEGVRDLIKFDVTDGINPLIDRYFYISIGSIDKVFPEVINKGVTLKEGGKVTLTTDLLSTSDINSPDENLRFSVTRTPRRGHLEKTDSPGLPITSFTQLELAGNKIYYIHTSDDEVRMDSFEFEVTDGFNPVFRTFRVSITDVDNKKPVLTVHDLVVSEGEMKLITPFELTVEDHDTLDSFLHFTITQVPVHGQLLYNKSQPITSFSKQDLNDNLISYKHDGTETNEDSFSFTVTDGTHTEYYVFPDTVFETRKPQTMKIQIAAVDNGVPQIVINKGAPTLQVMPTGHLGFMITNKALKAEDRDSPHKLLKYKIFEGPEHGYIINTQLGNDSITSFSQADIDDMQISYILREGDKATSDIFYFSVEDAGGNKLKTQPFRLNWAWISLERDYYLVDEDSHFLEVALKRRGYLGETSFVGIATRDGTAKRDKDFRGKSQKQVQFNPGQSTATWKVKILADHEYESSETFHIVLSDPVMAVLEFPELSTIEIVDPGDEPTIYIPQSEYRVEEDAGEVFVPVKRSGDLSQELMVICFTQQGTATGTIPSTILSYSDFITRPEDHTSVIRFDKEEIERFCRIVIIDDSLYEEEESFNVTISMPMGGQVGKQHPTTRIIILPDVADEPAFYFGDQDYQVDESAGYVEVRVWRTGTDLSKNATVTVRSRKTEPTSAKAGVDYVGISRNLDFAPGVTMQKFRVIILDDLGQPDLEGPEIFELVLRMPMHAVLGEPSKTLVTINDSISDLPKMQFKVSQYVQKEKAGHVTAMVYRSGDTSNTSTVRCYTRQGTAEVMRDYEERPNTDDSIVTFLPGETEKPCTVVLVDNTIYEEEEEFRLVLGAAHSESSFGATVGEQNETLIKIQDEGDKPIIRFSETKYSVQEPQNPGELAIVIIPVLRLGDTSKVSIVRVHTKDGSATSGEDYNPLSEDLEFKEGETEHVVEIEVVSDGEREMREAFTIHLKPDENMVAETQMNKAIVYIEEMDSVADVTFPAVPQVISLLMYDDTTKAKGSPDASAGYPVICVTACNPKYSDYDKTGSICSAENINDTLTHYRWLVSAPSGLDGVTSPLREVDSNTFFTSTKIITLDSIYFQAGSRVQCAARAFTAGGDAGLELLSPIITISREDGLCQLRVPGAVGAEPFSAKLRYTGSDDPYQSNLIKLTVTMPHLDGMLPVISTRPLSNFELTLSPDGTRVGNHKCSNLLDHHEIATRYGFINDAVKNLEAIGEPSPYQYSVALRSANTLQFYRNLNLEACLWEFTNYYDMSELLTDCGGTIGTDGQVLNLVQSYVTLRVPLFISYVFHSPASVGGWQHFDLQSELKLTFVYDTAILWKEGIGSPPEAELQGALYPTSMRINEEGRLVVNFKTEVRFRGQFVMSHPGTSLASMVMSADHPGLSFTLSLVRSEPTYNQPMQQWSFTSDFAVRDYSGTYTVKLVPCSSAPNQEYNLPIVCNPRKPITFDLDIRFQQVSDPVAAEFSLNTEMVLLSKRELWLSDGSMGFGEGTDVAFSEGSVIYGRVMVDPVQNLGGSFTCNIEKVFLCTGADGYVPKYNPINNEFGCLADSPSILYRFKILDKAQPESQAPVFGNVLFDARLAVDVPDAMSLVKQPGSDGFSFASDPLFQVTSGREWYIHVIYTVRSKGNSNRGIGKRSLEFLHHSLTSSGNSTDKLGFIRNRRSASKVPDVAQDIGAEKSRGTNIQHISLDRINKIVINQKDYLPINEHYQKPRLLAVDRETEGSILSVVGGAGSLLLLACISMIIFLLLKNKNSLTCRMKSSHGRHTSSNATVITGQSSNSSDSSEV
ncbi:FRAS1-related extracellular matrix protein 3 [Narcine bancroftii]|uniref:FRAS1-related extracellular matrix protein 3 n=1 Tax=Narcine bancroftii TaxID=1343680 RepID=UPI003831136D